MEKIRQSITNGINILNESKSKYLEDVKNYEEEITSVNVINSLTDESVLKNKITNLTKAANNSKSFVKYIDFIIDEFNKITNFVKNNNIPDLNHECIYFGTGTLFFSDKFLDYSEQDIFNILLNHIIHYTGGLYITHSAKARLSYILAMANACYGHVMNYKDGIKLYEKNIANYKNIIFDISPSYPSFIIRNRKMMPFIGKGNSEFCIYRLSIGNEIIFEVNDIEIENDHIKSIQCNTENLLNLRKQFNTVFSEIV